MKHPDVFSPTCEEMDNRAKTRSGTRVLAGCSCFRSVFRAKSDGVHLGMVKRIPPSSVLPPRGAAAVFLTTQQRHLCVVFVLCRLSNNRCYGVQIPDKSMETKSVGFIVRGVCHIPAFMVVFVCRNPLLSVTGSDAGERKLENEPCKAKNVRADGGIILLKSSLHRIVCFDSLHPFEEFCFEMEVDGFVHALLIQQTRIQGDTE